MKLFFLWVLLALSLTGKAADNKLQFYYKGEKYYFLAAYELVQVSDSLNKTVQSAYTDKYGRVNLRLKPGTYTCLIRYRKELYSFRFKIYSQANFRRVYFGESIKTYMRWG